MTTSLLRHEHRNLALELIQRGLRTSPTRLLTGLPNAEIRTLYRKVHGRSPPSGDAPCAASLIPNRRAQMRVSLFASLYRQIGGPNVFKQIDAQALIKGHDLYRELTEPTLAPIHPPLDITGAWVLAQELCGNTAWIKDCANCQAPYFESIDIKLPPACPFCVLRQERKRMRKPNARRESSGTEFSKFK
jgi:hypothetical protein